MNIKNWYIQGGAFCCDIKGGEYYTFQQCKIMSYNSKTNKIGIAYGGEKVEFILDFKKADSYFVTNNKIGKFREILAGYESLK
jgi:hypothetical protein